MEENDDISSSCMFAFLPFLQALETQKNMLKDQHEKVILHKYLYRSIISKISNIF